MDVKELKTYQQVYIYLIPILGNLGFINIIVVVCRVRWFEKHLKAKAPHLLKPEVRPKRDPEAQLEKQADSNISGHALAIEGTTDPAINNVTEVDESAESEVLPKVPQGSRSSASDDVLDQNPTVGRHFIRFANSDQLTADNDETLYIPPPWKRDKGASFTETKDDIDDKDEEKLDRNMRRLQFGRSLNSHTRTLERAITSVFVLGHTSGYEDKDHTPTQKYVRPVDLPEISSQITIGRNSQFYNMSAEDRKRLGGIEYRSLKLLLKIVAGYFLGLHLFGAIALVGWILHADPKYRAYLAECGQGSIWW